MFIEIRLRCSNLDKLIIGVPARTNHWCASKDAGPKGMGLGAVPHRLEEGKSASEDAGPGGVVDVMSLAVDLGRYKWYQIQVLDDVPAFSLFPEGG